MKKTVNTLLALVLAISFTAFTPVKKKVKVKESSITWTGKKVLGKHTGTINLKKGYLEMDGDDITGGEFVIDMTSLSVTDLEAGKGKEKLEGHLSSDDFFGIANHPTATLTIDSSKRKGNLHAIKGTITIKGVSQPISFRLKKEGQSANAKLVVDRTKFGIKYGSGSFSDNLGDKAINDNFDLEVSLKF